MGARKCAPILAAFEDVESASGDLFSSRSDMIDFVEWNMESAERSKRRWALVREINILQTR